VKSESTTRNPKDTSSENTNGEESYDTTRSTPNAYVAFGSNLQNPLQQLQHAYQALGDEVEIVDASSIYRTAPVGGPEGQDDFLNAVVAVRTRMSAQQLLKVLHKIEMEQGRERVVRWDARTLDLDLLSYKNLVLDTKRLKLPHPRMMERGFVLVPLCEIAADWVHPKTKVIAKDVLSSLDVEDIRKTDLSWI